MKPFRDGVRNLLTVWENSHADWCCSRGCSSPDGRHADIDGVRDWLTTLGAGDDPGELATHPCDGLCTCDVRLYAPALRALLDGAAS